MYVQTSDGQQTKYYIDKLCAYSRCCLFDLSKPMVDRDSWQDMVTWIFAIGTLWWWWWWWWYLVLKKINILYNKLVEVYVFLEMQYIYIYISSTAGEARTSSLAMYSCGPPHMDVQKQDDQHELTYSNYVRTQDVTLKTCRKR